MIKQLMLKKTGMIALVCLGATSVAVAHDETQQKVLYRGDNSAKGVCMSIVYDDVNGLARALRSGKLYPLEKTHLAYKCNDMALDEFAFTQNAEQVSDYLAPRFGGQRGHVSVEQVGSIGQ